MIEEAFPIKRPPCTRRTARLGRSGCLREDGAAHAGAHVANKKESRKQPDRGEGRDRDERSRSRDDSP